LLNFNDLITITMSHLQEIVQNNCEPLSQKFQVRRNNGEILFFNTIQETYNEWKLSLNESEDKRIWKISFDDKNKNYRYMPLTYKNIKEDNIFNEIVQIKPSIISSNNNDIYWINQPLIFNEQIILSKIKEVLSNNEFVTKYDIVE